MDGTGKNNCPIKVLPVQLDTAVAQGPPIMVKRKVVAVNGYAENTARSCVGVKNSTATPG